MENKEASWDATFELLYGEQGEDKTRTSTLEVWDHRPLETDKLIGSASFTPEELITAAHEKQGWYQIRDHKGDKAGEVYLEVKFTPGIVFHVHEAKDLRKVQLIGKQDPYVKFILGKQVSRTKESKDGERAPKWEETHYFARWPGVDHSEDAENALHLEVWDERTLLDEEIGHVKLPFSAMEKVAGEGQKWYPVYKNKKEENQDGEISITITTAPHPKKGDKYF